MHTASFVYLKRTAVGSQKRLRPKWVKPSALKLETLGELHFFPPPGSWALLKRFLSQNTAFTVATARQPVQETRSMIIPRYNNDVGLTHK